MRLRPLVTFDADEGAGGAPAAEPVAATAPAAVPDPAPVAEVPAPPAPAADAPSPRDAALAAVPEEHREWVQSQLDAAETFAPYADRYDADQLAAVIGLADQLQDPAARDDVIRELAEAFDVSLAEAEVIATPTEIPELDALRAELAQLREQVDGTTAATREAESLAQLQTEYSDIREQHGRDFSEPEEAALGSLAEALARGGSETPLRAAYDLIAGIAGETEASFFERVSGHPVAAESAAGRASTAAPEVDSFEEAERLLRERRNPATA